MSEILGQIQSVTYETALLGLFITAGAILISRDWRFLILVLLIQYILAGIILLQLVHPDIAVLKVLIGAFICPILFLSARQVSGRFSSNAFRVEKQQSNGYLKWVPRWQSLPSIESLPSGTDLASTGFFFRIFLMLIIILITITLSSDFPLPNLSPTVTTAIYWLGLSGLGVMMITEDPMKAGHGLFTTLIGFDLFYSTLESSLLLTGLWGTVNLLIALAIGYLTVVKGTGLEEER